MRRVLRVSPLGLIHRAVLLPPAITRGPAPRCIHRQRMLVLRHPPLPGPKSDVPQLAARVPAIEYAP